jgi:recombination protein RecT
MDDNKSLTVKRKTVSDLLIKFKGQIEMALPTHITGDRLIRTALTSFSKNPKLLECSPESLLGCVIQSAQLGLMPDGILGEAHLIPFWNSKKGAFECQFIPGYKGLVSLAFRSGQVSTFQGRVVYDSDFFEYEYGIDDKLIHRPSGKMGMVTHAYAVLKYANGGRMFEVMTVDEINYIRDTSANYKQAKKSGTEAFSVWNTYYEAMAIKTVIRKLSKLAPLSPEFQRAVSLDEQAEVIGTPQKLHYDLLELPEVSDEMKQPIENEIQEELVEWNEEKEKQKKEEIESKKNKTEQTVLKGVKK